MDMSNGVAWQVGEITLDDDRPVYVWFYPTARSERLVLRPRLGRLGQAA
jgi:hypothetical protein